MSGKAHAFELTLSLCRMVSEQIASVRDMEEREEGMPLVKERVKRWAWRQLVRLQPRPRHQISLLKTYSHELGFALSTKASADISRRHPYKLSHLLSETFALGALAAPTAQLRLEQGSINLARNPCSSKSCRTTERPRDQRTRRDMMEVPSKDQELRFRNVTLHSQDRKEHGTLYLFRHHLLFSYYDKAAEQVRSSGDAASNRSRGRVSTESSSLTESSVASTATGSTQDSGVASGRNSTAHDVDGASDRRKDARPKQRSKEIWLPYPLINHCVLRPSHLQSYTAQSHDEVQQLSLDPEAGELFPPTFGTASYDGRPSTDSAHLAPFSSPQRPSSPANAAYDSSTTTGSGRQPAIRIRSKDLKMMALHFHASQTGSSADDTARQAFYALRSRCCVERVEDLHAFHFKPPKFESEAGLASYDARREYARMGIGGKAADGPGTAWRITDINQDYSYSATYPSVICVPRTVSDNMLKYGGVFRSRSRIPCLAYLHHNGGSITRSSQPMVGVQNKRNPQDEKLVSAIFSSHTPPLQSPEDSPPQVPSLASPSTTTLDSRPSDAGPSDTDVPNLPISQSDTALHEKADDKATPLRRKIYGSTRRNLIVDARPKINALANRATGGGIEDVANYAGNNGMPVEKVFLNIANIHVMRSSLEKVFDSFANSDYIKIRADQEALRKSGWLGHIANMMDGAEMVARVVGLGGSHVLIHCSDGWDRTAQVSALAQIMLDPYYRTLDGFITLVQKDFLSFGHKFRDRNGIEGSEKWFEIENERIAPSRARDNNNADPNSLNALGSKALSGAKNWFEKGRSNLFRQQNASKDSLSGDASPSSRPPSPPPNPILHAPPSSTSKEEKEHRISEKEISPIFHQFLDAVYQLQYQYPKAFEFNERFLRRLFYHVYACQYGEFLFNSEKERMQYAGKVPSVWPHFAAKRAEYLNVEFSAEAEDSLLFAKRSGPEKEVEARWWHGLWGREDSEMNVPRALARTADVQSTVTKSGLLSAAVIDGQAQPQSQQNEKLVGDVLSEGDDAPQTRAKSTPNLEQTASSVTALPDGVAGLSVQDVPSAARASQASSSSTTAVDAPIPQTHPQPAPASQPNSEAAPPVPAPDYDGDPLGVSTTVKEHQRPPQPAPSVNRMDFAAFASQNAFRD